MAIEGKVEGGSWTNEWLLSTFVLFFLLFLHRSQFDCDLLKEKVECHRAENPLPRAVHRQPAIWLGSLDFYHILAGGVLIASKCSSSLWLLCFPLGTGPFAQEAVWAVVCGPWS